MSAPLDKPPVDTSAISSTQEENSRFQLSREMKILLGVLALGGAVGGWYFFSGAGTPVPDATTPPAQSTAVQPTAVQPSTPPAGQPGAAGTGTAGGTAGSATPGSVTPGAGTVTDPNSVVPTTAGVNSSSPVAVAQVPFLNPQTGVGGLGTGDPASTEPTGINPADPLAAVPDSNPFQPLTVVETATTASSTAPPPGQASTPLPTASNVNTAPASSAGLSSSGAIPLPSVPIGGVNGGGVNLGNTASGSTSSDTGTGLGTGGAIPLPSVPLGGLPTSPSTAGGATTGSAGTGTSGTGNTATTGTPAAPSVKPPPAPGSITPGLATPSLGNISLGSAAVPGTRPGSALPGTAGTPTLGNSSSTAGISGAGSAPDLSASIGQPGVISQYGSANVPAVPAPVVVSPLDQLVQSRNLVYNAVVLGPINTAIFKTDQGFVVVPTGQTLPDSTVVLKEVTATSATLSLGNDSKILELDKR